MAGQPLPILNSSVLLCGLKVAGVRPRGDTPILWTLPFPSWGTQPTSPSPVLRGAASGPLELAAEADDVSGCHGERPALDVGSPEPT